MKKLIIFDFDGTVMDGSVCIMTALKKTCDCFGIDFPDSDKLTRFIGPPIYTSMLNAGFSDEMIPSLLEKYREFCIEKNIIEKFSFYSGMKDLLATLKYAGLKLAIASMRTEQSLSDIDAVHHFSHYFDVISGRQGDEDTEIKSIIIKRVLDELNIDVEDSILVGDSEYDGKGAESIGMDFAGVTYGFGYKTVSDVGKNLFVCDSVGELREKLLLFCD